MSKFFRLETDETQFLRDGCPHRILGGALHYFRVLPESWEDRLSKYVACGLNTVETYVPWNLHEPTPGRFDFSGRLDLRRFIEMAGNLGLDVIVRPGPYICAEWENGGIPAWLLKDRALRARTAYPPFLNAAVRYYQRVVEEIGDLQSTKGGPIVAMQIENEYGSFGNDKEYLFALEKALKDGGIDVMLFTSDDASDYTLRGGTLPHLLKTVNFGSRVERAFETLRRHQPSGPLLCTELWLGWFDHWGKEHHVRCPETAAETVDQILSLGASFIIYMMHGGTNFGFLNGANNRNGIYEPVTTSYDYDAPLDERGAPTPKFFALREVLRKHGAAVGEPPPETPVATYEPVRFDSETVELVRLILELTSWDVRLLSKSSFLPRIAEALGDLHQAPRRVIYGVSTGTLNDDLAAAFELGTARVSKRLDSLHQLQDAGHRTFGMICPSLPQRDYDAFAREMAAAIRVERCEHVWAEVINVRGKSFSRTAVALNNAGFFREAASLAAVSGPGSGDAWQAYARETFEAHTRTIQAHKLRFLQYPTPKTLEWWQGRVNEGAVLLGKAVHG